MTPFNPIDIVVYVPVGLLLGAVYFALLRRSLPDIQSSTPIAAYFPLFAARFGLAAFAFWCVAQAGAVPVLLALSGFLLARGMARRLALPR